MSPLSHCPRPSSTTQHSALSTQHSSGHSSRPRRSSRFHWLITLLVSAAFAGNGITLSAVSFALPGVRREWGLPSTELGLMTAAVAAGQICGALLVGWLADRLGRRHVFPLTLALMSIATALAGLAPSPAIVVLLFFVAGIGFGGVAPVAVSLLGEFAPPAIRGQLMAWTQVFWASGWCLTAAGGAALSATLGWRYILAISLAPLLLAVLAWRTTPESPRFLLAQGRRAEAEALVEQIEARHGVRLPLPAQQLADRRANPLRSLAELWGPRFRRRTFTIWLTWMIMVASFNGPIIMLPSVLAAAGASDALAARTSLIVGLFMLPAIVVCLLLIDRIGRRPLMLASLGLAALGSFGLALAGSEPAVILTGGLLAAGTLAAWPVILGYAAELYPTRMRASAGGWASAISRIGGIGAPLLIGGLVDATGGDRTVAFGTFGVLLLVAVALMAVSGEETSGRTLEELSG